MKLTAATAALVAGLAVNTGVTVVTAAFTVPSTRVNNNEDDLDLTTAATTTTATTTPLCESIVNLFRRVLPSSFSSTAWWLSVHTLGLCDMMLLEVDGSHFSVTIANTHCHNHTHLEFGLWACSDIIFETHDDDFVMFCVNQWEQLHKKHVCPLKGGMCGDTPLFVIDSKFMLARICALLTTASGFTCMMILWTAVVRDESSHVCQASTELHTAM